MPAAEGDPSAEELTKVFSIMENVTCKELASIREKGDGDKQYDANED